MQTIKITISGEDLSDLEIRKLPRSGKPKKKDALNALHEALYRNEVKENAELQKPNARHGDPV